MGNFLPGKFSWDFCTWSKGSLFYSLNSLFLGFSFMTLWDGLVVLKANIRCLSSSLAYHPKQKMYPWYFQQAGICDEIVEFGLYCEDWRFWGEDPYFLRNWERCGIIWSRENILNLSLFWFCMFAASKYWPKWPKWSQPNITIVS